MSDKDVPFGQSPSFKIDGKLWYRGRDPLPAPPQVWGKAAATIFDGRLSLFADLQPFSRSSIEITSGTLVSNITSCQYTSSSGTGTIAATGDWIPIPVDAQVTCTSSSTENK